LLHKCVIPSDPAQSKGELRDPLFALSTSVKQALAADNDLLLP